MRFLMGLLLLASLPLRAEDPSEEETLAWLNYELAVAEAPGDAMSDLRLKGMLGLTGTTATPPGVAASPVSEPKRAYLARAQVVAAELAVRVEAARDSDPFLLGVDLGCHPRTADMSICDSRRAKLEAFASDNAYHGLVVMTQAWRREDAEGFLRTARLAAAAETYDSVPAAGFASLRDRYRRVPAPDLPRMDALTREHTAEVMAMGFAAATAFPSHQDFVTPCRESEGELRDHCLAIARKMVAQGGNAVETWIAKSLLETIGTPADIEMARARMREAQWLSAKAMPLLDASQMVAVSGLDEYFAAFGSAGEFAAMRALLAVHGIAPLPPAGWTYAPPRATPQK